MKNLASKTEVNSKPKLKNVGGNMIYENFCFKKSPLKYLDQRQRFHAYVEINKEKVLYAIRKKFIK